MLVFPLLLLIGIWLTAQWSQSRYQRLLQAGQHSAAGPTATELARAFLDYHQADKVQIVPHRSIVTDYYEPHRQRLFLHPQVAEGRDLASWAIALHEAAHATQRSPDDLAALHTRRRIIQLCRYLPTLLFILFILAAVLLKLQPRVLLPLFAVSCALLSTFHLGTLAIEKQANAIALHWLRRHLEKQPRVIAALESLLPAMATRELRDILHSPRYFFLGALPGGQKLRPR
jgi:uncharacterized protein